jgi:hypothetical protein
MKFAESHIFLSIFHCYSHCKNGMRTTRINEIYIYIALETFFIKNGYSLEMGKVVPDPKTFSRRDWDRDQKRLVPLVSNMNLGQSLVGQMLAG